MNIKVFSPLLLIALLHSPALASQELTSLIRCHEALNDKSEGRSTKLSLDAATPFLLPSGKNLYFVTDESVAVIENKFAGQEVVIQLTDNKTTFYRKLSFQKNGEAGTISFDNITADDQKKALTPTTQLDDKSLNLIKKELLKRMESVTAEYQNKYNPEGTIEALSICNRVTSPELQKSLEKQISFYEKLARRKSSGKGDKAKNPYGTK